jgi:hypothetical protein
MKQNNLTKFIQKIKDNEDSTALLLIKEDKILQQLIITWSKVPKQIHPILQEPLTHFSIWQSIDIDKQTWKRLSNLDISQTLLNQKIEVLTHNLIIYPDGTIHKIVDNYLKTLTLELFPQAKR